MTNFMEIKTTKKSYRDIESDLLIVGLFKNNKLTPQLKSLDAVDETDLILDIGKRTTENISKIINESKTVLWNGPAGYFEI